MAGYVGEITWFADNILRKNHVWADGAPIDPAQWPDLAAYAATAGWAQNAEGQYLVPDLRGRFLLGVSETHTVGSTGGSETVALTIAQMPGHKHYSLFDKTGNTFTTTEDNTGMPRAIETTGLHPQTGSIVAMGQSTGENAPHNNMPPYYTASAKIRAKVDTIQAHLSVCPYEVGDILQTKSATPPAERWPGTEWEAVETFLLGASAKHAVNSTGGEETVTLTKAQLAAHSHTVGFYSDAGTVSGHVYSDQGTQTSYLGGPGRYGKGDVTETGENQSHNNMPPYTAVYIWERTA